MWLSQKGTWKHGKCSPKPETAHTKQSDSQTAAKCTKIIWTCKSKMHIFPICRTITWVTYEQNNLGYHQMERKQGSKGSMTNFSLHQLVSFPFDNLHYFAHTSLYVM